MGNFLAIILKYDVNTTLCYVIVTIKLNLLDVKNIQHFRLVPRKIPFV